MIRVTFSLYSFFTLVPCPELTNPTNGFVAFTMSRIAIYICNSGYQLVGSNSRTCQDNRQWSGIEPYCEEGTAKFCQIRHFFYWIVDKQTDHLNNISQ